MSIVRVGLSETKKFASGYDAIFGKKGRPAGYPRAGRPAKPTAKKKSAKKK